MKEEIFNQYVERVCDMFGISISDFYTKSKKRELADARQLVYYLCVDRNIEIVYIQKYMSNNGYVTPHSTISHGVSIVKEKVSNDEDYSNVVKEMNKAVFI